VAGSCEYGDEPSGSGATELVSLCVQTGSGANPASCTIGIGDPFPGAETRPGVMLTTNPHLVPRSRMGRSYTPSPPNAYVACSGTALALT
jgi:hypothetical protein